GYVARAFGLLRRRMPRSRFFPPPREVTARFGFGCTELVKGGGELVCAKKDSKLISRVIVQSLIATPRGRRTYPENKTNRWRITRRCGVPQAKPAVSRDICAEQWVGTGSATPR